MRQKIQDSSEFFFKKSASKPGLAGPFPILPHLFWSSEKWLFPVVITYAITYSALGPTVVRGGGGGAESSSPETHAPSN